MGLYLTGRVQINEISPCLLTADTLHSKNLECIASFNDYLPRKSPDSINAF